MGISHTGEADIEWSILDTGSGDGSEQRGTIVCVHGNPTWGYLWRDFLHTLSPEWRVIAVDQTGMGWSQRGTARTLDGRVADLVAFCEQHTDGPLVLVAHDWGGPVVLGALSSLEVRAVILGNTGVGLPERTSVPPLIAIARRFVDILCRRTSAFVSGSARMTKKDHRTALRSPYQTADRRMAVAEFVADIPLSEQDISWGALSRSAENLESLEAPLLLVWGGRDPVFHDQFLGDLLVRAPHAVVHRFPNAGHLVPLDEPMAEIAKQWLESVLGLVTTDEHADEVKTDFLATHPFLAITDALAGRASDATAAFTDASGSLTWKELATEANAIARMLVTQGLIVGDRVALLVPPGIALLPAAYGVWLAGGVNVVADSGLGAKGLRSALRAADVSWVFGTPKTLPVSRVLGWTPGARSVCTQRFPRALNVKTHPALMATQLPRIEPEFEAAVVHTSGSTGPAKPVRYCHGALAAQRDAIRDAFRMSAEKGFVTSFAPFILLGPALGVPCVLPDIDVTKPSELDFDRFSAVLASTQIDVAWLSPASARRIVETAAGRHVNLRLVMLAGAPIAPSLASAIAEVTGADVRSPWGMTEAMPLTDGVGASNATSDGTMTGRPLPGVEVVILGIGSDNAPLASGAWGEFAVATPWMFDGYQHQWATKHDSEVSINGRRFHRTGDLGTVNANGELLQLGRKQHALFLATQTVPNARIEQPIAAALGSEVAAVGCGPSGAQVIVVVLSAKGKLRLASAAQTAYVRGASTFEIAAVLEGELPVDIRHQSKVKREVLAADVSEYLAGR